MNGLVTDLLSNVTAVWALCPHGLGGAPATYRQSGPQGCPGQGPGAPCRPLPSGFWVLPCSGSCGETGPRWALVTGPLSPALGPAASSSQPSVSPRAYPPPLIQDQSLPYGPGPSPPAGPHSRSASGPRPQRGRAHFIVGACVPGGPPVASGAGPGPRGSQGGPCAPAPSAHPRPGVRAPRVCSVPSALCPFTRAAPGQTAVGDSRPPRRVWGLPAHQGPWLPHEESPPVLRGLPRHHCGGDLGTFATAAPAEVQTYPAWRDPCLGRSCLRQTVPQPLWWLSCSHSVVSDSATPQTAARQALLSFTVSRNLLKLMSIESVMPSNHLILCRPLLLLSSIFPSSRVFSNESTLRIRWPKDGASASASVLPMNIQD